MPSSFSGRAANYGLLYEGHGGKTLSYNNSNETGNIGIGYTGAFQGNGPGTITGLVDFSAASAGQFSNSGVTLIPSTNNPAYNVAERHERSQFDQFALAKFGP